MGPRRTVECDPAAGVGAYARLIVCNRDQTIARTPGNTVNIRAGHPGVALVVDRPGCAVEVHQATAGRPNPNTSARIGHQCNDVITRQSRVTGEVEVERG